MRAWFRVVALIFMVCASVALTPAAHASVSRSPQDVDAFGDAGFFGSTGSTTLNSPIVGMAATATGRGYWLLGEDGGVFGYGDAKFYGSTGNSHLVKPVVGMAATPSGHGYWFVAADGGVFAFGDAKFYGSTGNIALREPIVGMAATPTGRGYWLVASDGGIFAFGDARFHGSTGNIALHRPVVGMAPTSTGNGYWLVASDGGIFAFGGARFHGSTGAIALAQPITGMAATPTGNGYWLVARDGGLFAFGGAHYYGSMAGSSLGTNQFVGMARTRSGHGYWMVASGPVESTVPPSVPVQTPSPPSAPAPPPSPPPTTAPQPPPGQGAARGFPDYNKDGYADVVVSMDQQAIGSAAGAGGIEIVYGTPFGSGVTPRTQYLSNSDPAVAGGVIAGGRFGQDWASGDFNGDGYDDLAVGEYGATISGHTTAGQVHIFYGGPSGLTDGGYQHIDLDEVGLAHTAATGDQFGHTLAGGDINGDGYADLVVSAPREAVDGANRAGAVYVFWGSASGLQFTAAQGALTFHQGSSSLGGTATLGTILGSPVAIGDFDHDGHGDIAIGVQGQAIARFQAPQTTQGSGAFYIVYGNSTKADVGTRTQFFTEDTEGMPATTRPAASLGGWLTPGDYNHDGYTDLAVSAEGIDLAPVPNDGAVYVLNGGPSGLTTTGAKLFDEPSLGISAQTGANEDNFGDSLASGDFNHDGYADLVIALDCRNLSGVSGTKHGEILVLPGSASGVTTAGMKTLTENSSGLAGSGAQNGDQFGSRIQAGDYNHDGYIDLYVAAGGETVSGHTHAGVVYLLRGSSSGITVSGSKLFTQSSPEVAGGAQTDAWFGSLT